MILYANQNARDKFEDLIETTDIGIPSECPECGGDIEIHENGQVRCINPDCRTKYKHMIFGFFRSFEVKNAGEAFVDEISKTTKSFEEVIDAIKAKDEEKFRGWSGGVNGKKVLDGMTKALETPIKFAKFIDLFDIEGVGSKKMESIEDLLDIYCNGGSLDATLIAERDGWSPTSAYQFVTNVTQKEKLIKYAFDSKIFKFGDVKAKAVFSTSKLAGMSFCFTGAAEAFKPLSRPAIEEMVKGFGGTISSVKKGLTYLVTDNTESGSSKNKKAKELGIPVITSYDLKKIIDCKE